MRDFEIIKDIAYSSIIFQKRISQFLKETFKGVGVIQQGVTIININSASEQYKQFIVDSCELDCYIFTPDIFKDMAALQRLEIIFENLKISKRNITFVNIYDSKNNSHLNNSFLILYKFLEKNMIKNIYCMDINEEFNFNKSYFINLEKKYLELKANTELKMSNIIKFLQQYDSMMQDKEEYTAKHGRAVCRFSLEIGKKLKLSKSQLKVLAVGAALHDIGKYEVDISILTKNIKLSSSEFRQIKDHPLIGKAILDIFIFTELSEEDNEIIEFIIEQHHERYDGKGYPREIDYSVIHPFSMIVSIADAFHAMLGRNYQIPKTRNEILQEIIECSGKQFCPKYVEIFSDMLFSDLDKLGLHCDENGYLSYVSKDSIVKIIKEI